MDGYQFIASLFASLVSLAWPAALVACVWIFRDKLREMLPFIRVKGKDIEVSFRLDQAERDAKELPKAELPDEAPTPEERTRFEKLVDVSPRAAIMEGRREIEEALTILSERFAETDKMPKGILMLTRLLRKRGIIGEYTSALLDDLRAIGNAAAHDNTVEFAKEDARRFRNLADDVLRQLSVAQMNQSDN